MLDRWTTEEMRQLAQSAVTKVDLLGPEGTAHCTSDEVEAMAGLIVSAGVLTKTPPEDAPKLVFRTRRKTSLPISATANGAA